MPSNLDRFTAAQAAPPFCHFALGLGAVRVIASVNDDTDDPATPELFLTAVMPVASTLDMDPEALLSRPQARTPAFVLQQELVQTVYVHEPGKPVPAYTFVGGSLALEKPAWLPAHPAPGHRTVTFTYRTTDTAEDTAYALKMSVLYLSRTRSLPVHLASDPTGEPQLLSGAAFADEVLHEKTVRTPYGPVVLYVAADDGRLHNFNAGGRTRRLKIPALTPALQDGCREPPPYQVLVDASDSDDICTRYWSQPAKHLDGDDAILTDLLLKPARTALYEYFSRTPGITPKFSQWTDARKLGVDYPEPPPKGRPWSPTPKGEAAPWREPVAYNPETALIADGLTPPEAFLLSRLPAAASPWETLIRADSHLSSFSWYGKTHSARGLRVDAVVRGKTVRHRLWEQEERPEGVAVALADTLEVAIDTEDGGWNRRQVRIRGLHTAWGGPTKAAPDLCTLYRTGEAPEADVHDLARVLSQAFFIPVCDTGADSAETQYDNFHFQVLRDLLNHFRSPQEAYAAVLAHLVDGFRHHLKHDLNAVITLTGKDAAVSVEQPER